MAKKPITIVSRSFTTADAVPQEQFEAWRRFIAPIYDVASVDRSPSSGFKAEVHASHLGHLLVGRSSFDSHRFFRDPSRIRRDTLDHVLVQLCLEGGYAGAADGRELSVRAGSIALIDLARPLALEALPSRTIEVIVPRTLLERTPWRDRPFSGLVLEPEMPTASLLLDLLLSIGQRVTDLAQDAVPAVIEIITAAVAACFAPLLPPDVKQQAATESFQRVKAYIDSHFTTPGLSPSDICRDVGVSRATLYRMFDSFGGVAAYIQNQRLLQAYALLAAPPADPLRVQTVASACGYVSVPHFHRSFRRLFGVTPKDVQAAHPKRRTFPAVPPSSDLSNVWISQLSKLAG